MIYAVAGLTVSLFAVVLVSLTIELVGGRVPEAIEAPTVTLPPEIPAAEEFGTIEGLFWDSKITLKGDQVNVDDLDPNFATGFVNLKNSACTTCKLEITSAKD